MPENASRTTPEMLAENDLISAALKRAAREAILAHAHAGRAVPMLSGESSQILWIAPEAIVARCGKQYGPVTNNS
jgi:hypothetical protein